MASNLTHAQIDIARRRSLGIYYTPKNAASILARWAITRASDRILEPSSGGCTMLEAAAVRLRDLGCRTPSSQLFGFDVDESAFVYLRRLLGSSHARQFHKRDFLTASPKPSSVDVVIANPPFVSYHRMNKNQRDVIGLWREKHKPEFPLNASLWAYFLCHSLSFLKQGGRIAFVLPSAADSADYAHPILTRIASSFDRILLFRIRQQLFIQAGAEERTVVLLAEGHRHNRGMQSTYISRSVATTDELESFLAQSSVEREQNSEQFESVAQALELITKLRETPRMFTLGSIASVKIGEVIGDSQFFSRSSLTWHELGIPTKCLRPIITKTRQAPGLRITRYQTKGLLGSIPGLLVINDSKLVPSVKNLLAKYPKIAKRQNRTFAKRNPWYSVSYDASADAFIGSISHSFPRIIWNSARISCANGLYKIKLHRDAPYRSAITLAALTTPFRLSAEARGRIRGSGFLKLEPSDVLELILPEIDLDAASTRDLFHRVEALVRSGEMESATRLADKVLYVDAGILTASELVALNEAYRKLRGERVPFASLKRKSPI